MKKLTCDMCGSTDLVKQDGLFVCQYCGTKYSVEDAKKMMAEGTVDVSGSTIKVDTKDRLDNLYKLARRAKEADNYAEMSEYYGQIAIENPNDWEAALYKAVGDAGQGRIMDISNNATTFGSSLTGIFGLAKLVEDKVEREKAYNLIALSTSEMAFLFFSNVVNTAKSCEDGAMRLELFAEHSPGIAYLFTVLGDNLSDVGMKEMALTEYKNAEEFFGDIPADLQMSIIERLRDLDPEYASKYDAKEGCYIATAVYGSYDCPQVWTLRRFRDISLKSTRLGTFIVKVYYWISPKIINSMGDNVLFVSITRHLLDSFVDKLGKAGFKNSPYVD